MKRINNLAVVAVIAIVAVSCVEKSEKFQHLAAERDSLQLQTEVLEVNYNETLGILNDVEEGFAQIRKAEGKMIMDAKQPEGTSTTKREQMAYQLNHIKEMLEQNRERIEQLQRQSSQRGKENAALNKTIARMQSELEQKSAIILALQTELENKNVQISDLTNSIGQLNAELIKVNETSEMQKQQIASQDIDMNTVHYVVASADELKASHILHTNGLFRPSTVLDREFDLTAFTKVDKRNIRMIVTESKRAKVLTAHPKDSYQLITGDDKQVVVEILNPTTFWSVSKYLVIQR